MTTFKIYFVVLCLGFCLPAWCTSGHLDPENEFWDLLAEAETGQTSEVQAMSKLETVAPTFAILGPAFNESDLGAWVNIVDGRVEVDGLGRSIIWSDNVWPADCHGTVTSVDTKVVLSDGSSFDNPELRDCTEPPTVSPTRAPTAPTAWPSFGTHGPSQATPCQLSLPRPCPHSTQHSCQP